MSVDAVYIIKEPLIDIEKVILLPLHINLGLMKQFVRALNKDGDCFKNISRVFPELSSKIQKQESLIALKFV